MTLQEALNYKPVGMYMYDSTFLTVAEEAIWKQEATVEELFKLVQLCDEAYGTEVDYTTKTPAEWVADYREDIAVLFED